jgi:hypothetical protein
MRPTLLAKTSWSTAALCARYVFGAGGYRFSDFPKIGAPLNIPSLDRSEHPYPSLLALRAQTLRPSNVSRGCATTFCGITVLGSRT